MWESRVSLKHRTVWGIVPAFDRLVLERIRGTTLLETAINSFHVGKQPVFKYVIVGTSDEVVAGAAQKYGAVLPRRLLINEPIGDDHRARTFCVADFVSQESQQRIYRWERPDAVVSIDPFFPFQSYPTIESVYAGCRKDTMSIPVVDVYPGLVKPVWCVFGHVYAPPGCRPHEDYEGFTNWSGGKPFTVNMVRITALSETFDVHDEVMRHNANNLLVNRSFRFSIALGADECYVPVKTSWGAYIPTDANFYYDAAHDVRVLRGNRGK